MGAGRVGAGLYLAHVAIPAMGFGKTDNLTPAYVAAQFHTNEQQFAA